MAVASPPEAIDPRYATSAVATRLSSLVALPLFAIGDDLLPTPMLAAAPAEHDDPLTWIVRLRPGLRFHDGAPVTARDVVFTFRAMADPALGSPHVAKLAPIAAVTALDDLTVRFTMKAPYPPFLVDINAYGILEEAVCGASKDACRMAPMGCGPYKVARALDANETLRLEADDASGTSFGAPPIRAIEVRVARDNTTRLLELEDGRIDLVVGDLLPTDVDVLARQPGIAIERAPGLGFSYLAFNVRDGAPFADTAVRTALAQALDVDRIIRTKLRGRAERATSLLPAAHWAHDGALAPIAFDPAAARAALRAYGKPVHVTLLTTTDRLRVSVAEIFAQQWRDVGVDVDVVVRDWGALYEDIQKGAFDAFSAKWVPVLEPDLMHWVYASSAIPAPGKAGGNRSGYANAAVDDLLARARAADTQDERRALYVEAQRAIAADIPVVPLWFEDELAAHSTRLVGFTLTSTVAYLPLARARLVDSADPAGRAGPPR